MRKYIKHLCAILILLCTSASAWGAAGDEITNATNIVSGKWYYIKGVRSNGTTIEYLTFIDGVGSTANGTSANSTDGAIPLKFTYESSSWYITTPKGYYISPAATNGKIIVTTEKTAVTIGTSGSKITIQGASFYLQKNGSASNFGGYNNNQQNVTLIEAATYSVNWSVNGGSCSGSPSTIGFGNHKISTLPTTPSSSDCDNSKVFVGWTASQISGSTNTRPSDLFTHANGSPAITGDVSFYAVFATRNDFSTLLSEDFSSITNGDNTSTSGSSSAWSTTTDNFTASSYAYQAGGAVRLGTSSTGYLTTKELTASVGSILTIAFDVKGWSAIESNIRIDPNNSEFTAPSVITYSSTMGESFEHQEVSVILTTANPKVKISSITGRAFIDNLVITKASYTEYLTTCASCSSAPLVGDAAFEGIAAGTISVSCDAIENDVGCATEEYGFVYKTGATAPTSISDGTKVVVDTDGSGDDGFDADLSIAFTTGTTYQIVAYATNAAGTTLGNAVAVVPQSVAFNSNGGSEVATQYVKSGGTVSVPSDPTKSGFVFGGWFQESGLSTPVDWSAAITADMTYYAKWLTYSDYVFTCAELTLTAHPETENAPIFITSVAGKKVRSQGYIQITGSGLTPSTALTFPSLPGIFEVKTAAYGDLATDASGAIDAAAYIFYTPGSGDTSDGLDKITGITVTVGGAKTKTVNLTQDIIGRHLPADFVIAGKKDGKWYALPSNMESTSHPAPSEIAVDNTTNPAIAYTDASNKYGLEGPTTSVSGNIKSGVGQYVKLTMHPLSDAPLFGMAPSNTAIGKSGTAVATHDLSAGYWWQLKQTNTSITNPQDAKYTIYCANNTSSLSIKDNAGSPEWGLYASGVEELRLIPASSIVFAEAEIVEWGQHGAIIEVDATTISATKVKAILNEAESAIVAASQTGTSVKGSSTKYNYTAAFGDRIDFAAATSNGAMLTLEWYNSSSVLVAVSNINVPKIIAANATMSSIASGDAAWSSAEVHVLPGVTLEANAGSFLSSDVTIDQLEIYPGATVQITTGTLDVRKLVLRNGWKRIGGTAYNTAHLYIADDANLTKTNNSDVWYSDWYIDYDQYYPIAVPWDVTVSNMRYKNTNNAASAGVKLLYYDGESRANNGQTGVGDGDNWKEYGADGNKPKPTTLKPGMGYAMTARRPTGKAFSIVRLPMTFSNPWGADGEQGEVDGTHKDQVTVTAYGAGAEPAKPTYLIGWNFIANPYMANYQGTIEYADGDKINVVNIPDVNFKEYGQYATATTKLAPASGFLIQAPKDGTLTFGTANRKNAAPSYRKANQADAVPEQQAYIMLSSENSEDMMGIFVSEKYTADYDLNGDVEKLLSDGNTLRTYMHYGDMNMAYVAINEMLAREWIPVNVRLPQSGEYTFSMHEASIAGELEGVYLIDYANGNMVTNLMEESYLFAADAGTISGRFAINALIGEHKTPTAIDVVGVDKTGDGPIKFLYRDKVYIWHKGNIYDATGKKVKGGQK